MPLPHHSSRDSQKQLLDLVIVVFFILLYSQATTDVFISLLAAILGKWVTSSVDFSDEMIQVQTGG